MQCRYCIAMQCRYSENCARAPGISHGTSTYIRAVAASSLSLEGQAAENILCVSRIRKRKGPLAFLFRIRPLAHFFYEFGRRKIYFPIALRQSGRRPQCYFEVYFEVNDFVWCCMPRNVRDVLLKNAIMQWHQWCCSCG